MRKAAHPASAFVFILAVVIAFASGWIAGAFLPAPLRLAPSARKTAPPSSQPAWPVAQGPSVPAPAADPRALGAPRALEALGAFSAPGAFGALSDLVPDVRQSTGYTCGAAALQAVLASWGTSEREDRLAARLNSTPEAGTHPLDILRVAREFGLTADLREGLGLADLEAALASGTSVIVDLQAWRDRTDLPWTETWEDGHYMVLLGMDAENLYFEDPSLLGSRGVIPRGEFVDRWHDYEGDPPLDPTDRKYIRAAMFFKGSRPAPAAPVPFERVR